MDAQGFFHKTSEAGWKHADTDAALAELDAQINRALAEGMTLTHVDTHMGSVAHPTLIPGYVQLAIKHGLPAMIPRMTAEELMTTQGLDEETAQTISGTILSLEEMGLPLLDSLSGLHLVNAEDRFEQAKQALCALKPGLTHFIIHPSKDTPELRQITDSWDCRVADFETFTNDATRDLIRNEGIQVIGYQAIKEIMPTFD